jgi:hypothetical protein
MKPGKRFGISVIETERNLASTFPLSMYVEQQALRCVHRTTSAHRSCDCWNHPASRHLEGRSRAQW